MEAAWGLKDRSPTLLSLLCDNDRLLSLIHDVGARRGWWCRSTNWRRSYGRFHFRGEAIASLLFETHLSPQQICLVEVFRNRPQARATDDYILRVEDAIWLRFTRFPFDPSLPGLPRVLRLGSNVIVMRYHPSQRCTLQVRVGHSLHYAKVYSSGIGADIHQKSVFMWQAARRNLLAFDVAKPGHWDAETCTLWQKAVNGIPITHQLLADTAEGLVDKLGRASGSLAQAPLKPKRGKDFSSQVEMSCQLGAELISELPAGASDINQLIDDLRALRFLSLDQRLKPIHGTLRVDQWLYDGNRLGLVDFDDLCMGHPEQDVASMLLGCGLQHKAKKGDDPLGRRFIAAYEDSAGPLNRSLVSAFLAMGHLTNAHRKLRRIRMNVEKSALREIACAQEYGRQALNGKL